MGGESILDDEWIVVSTWEYQSDSDYNSGYSIDKFKSEEEAMKLAEVLKNCLYCVAKVIR
jgi:hypothetical protein